MDVAASSQQYALPNSNGATWTVLVSKTLAVHESPSTVMSVLAGGNADLWTATAGVNQDIGIFVSVNGGTPELLAWKESGGVKGAFSPNAAFVQGVMQLTAGNSYTFLLEWKTNHACACTIYAGAGPAAPYSPTSLTLEQIP
jgi:hypothetical protein